jgi:hypothetical protein
MRRKLMMLFVSILLFGCLGWAADKSWKGVVSDEHCGAKHSTASADAAACVEKCVSGGAKYVLVSGGKVYQVDAQDQFKGLGGKQVKVTGTLSGDAITVTSLAEVKHKKDAKKAEM